MSRAGSVDLPGEVAGMVGLNELVLHGWDLARSTGQPFGAQEAHLHSTLALLAALGDSPPAGSPFGPPVPVPDDAPLLDRAVARSGGAPTGSRAADTRPRGSRSAGQPMKRSVNG